jgi:hypothetical protein
MKKRFVLVTGLFFLFVVGPRAQEAVVSPPESLVVAGVQKIPLSLAETAGRYGAYRSAAMVDWHPTQRAMLVSTPFAETPQLHLVSAPAGQRQQLTFYSDAVRVGRFHPTGGDYIVFSKDLGGGEWYQLLTQLSGGGWQPLDLKDEDGVSVLHVFSLARKKEIELPKLPVGVMGGLRWHKNNHDLAQQRDCRKNGRLSRSATGELEKL